MKTYLIIDTATDVLYVAVYKHGTLAFESKEKGSKDHAVKLMPLVIDALAQTGTSQGDLSGIIAGVGPGSYTGVRMGVVVAKMLAKEWNVKLYSTSTLTLMASSHQGQIIAYIDARREHVFGSILLIEPTVEVLLEPVYIAKEALFKQAPEATRVDTLNPDIPRLIEQAMFEPVQVIDDFQPNYARRTHAEIAHNDS